LRELFQDPSARVRAAAESSLRKRGALPPRPAPPPVPGRYTFKLYADHSQFYVGDSAFDGDTGAESFWSKEAFERRLAISPPSLLGIGTARYDYEPVVVDVGQTPPVDDLDERSEEHTSELQSR